MKRLIHVIKRYISFLVLFLLSTSIVIGVLLVTTQDSYTEINNYMLEIDEDIIDENATIEESDELPSEVYTTMYESLKYKKYLSDELKDDIVKSIEKYSLQYDLDPYIVYSILKVESHFKPWATHPQVVVKINNINKSTRAVGMSGIIYEIWHPTLSQHGIHSKGDLRTVKGSIKGLCVVLSALRTYPKVSSKLSELDSAIIRYNGVVKLSDGSISLKYLTKVKSIVNKIKP